MGDWVLEDIARFEGISEADIKTIEDAIEPAQQLLGVVKQAMPLINTAAPLIQKILPAATIILAAVAKWQQPKPTG